MARTKYTLIERTDCHPTAVPSHLLQDMKDSGDYDMVSSRPITLQEIKRLGVRVITEEMWKRDMEHRARLEAFEAYRARYHGVVTDAEVLSWDHLRGEGLLRLADGSARTIYACNIPGRKTWYPETACVFYEEGETVQVKLDIHVGQTFVLGVTPGHIDNEKWDSLDHSKLAFRCNEQGEAVTGLLERGGGAMIHRCKRCGTADRYAEVRHGICLECEDRDIALGRRSACERCDGPGPDLRALEPGDPGSSIYLQVCDDCFTELAEEQYRREPELNPDR